MSAADAHQNLRVAQKRTLLRDQVRKKLRNAIVQGWYAPGSRLTERELCEALGVSRTSVREVLRQLETEKLVHMEPKVGPIVAVLTLEDARQIYETREIVEGAIIRLFVARASAAEIARLTRYVDDFERAAACLDLPALLASMEAFYGTILDGAGNAVLTEIMSQLLARIGALRAKTLSVPGRLPASVAEMRAIVEAIARREAEPAAAAGIRHVRNASLAAQRELSGESGASLDADVKRIA